MNDNGEVVQGNDWTSMFQSTIGTLTNAFVTVTDASKASPNGNVKPQSPNPAPGMFGPFPQNQVNTQGNLSGILSSVGLGKLAGGGMGLLIIGLIALFLLRK